MAKYRALQAFPIEHPGNPKRQLLVRAGDEIELADDVVADHAIGVSIEPLDKPAEVDKGEVELPERPSNGATKEAWSTYLQQLEAATIGELGPLNVPADAKRDDMIVLGDARVAEWNEG